MPALTTFVTTTTQTRLLPKVIENILDGNVLSMRLLRQAKAWMGGTSIDIAVSLSDITAVGSYSGFDTLPTTQENVRQRAVFTPSQLAVAIPISGIQRAANQGDAAVINLVAQEIEWRTNRLRDEFGRQIYLDGTGNDSKDILGLVAYIDDTTNVGTYAGISRTTFTNWRATLTAQAGSLSLANFASDFDVVTTHGENLTIYVTTPAVFTIYEALLTPTVSHQFSQNDFRMTADGMVKVGGTLAANQGFRATTFRGIPVVADPKCTTANIFGITEPHLNFYTLNQPGRQVKNGFGWTGFKEPVNQDATVAHLLWYGQLIGDAPRLNTRRTGVTS